MKSVRKGRVALVTGASRGIGRAIALELGKCGFHVIIASRTVAAGEMNLHGITEGVSVLPGSLEETAALIKEQGATTTILRLDLKNASQCIEAIQNILVSHGRIDVFVNNAIYKGKGDLQRAMDLNETDYNEMIQCNLLTPFRSHKTHPPVHASCQDRSHPPSFNLIHSTQSKAPSR